MEDKTDIFVQQLKIEEFILQKIDSQQYQEEPIPSENELSSAFSVNRHTVRKAIERLCKLGRIYAVQGKGSYVSKKPSTVIYPVLSKGCFSDKLSREVKIIVVLCLIGLRRSLLLKSKNAWIWLRQN